MPYRFYPRLILLFASLAGPLGLLRAQDRLLNASFDVSRELFEQINPAFVAQWKASTGRDLTIQQSHVGSSQQARSVRDGLAADVVTLNQATDVDMLAAQHLVATDWRTRFPDHAAPYTSITTFVVLAGNPLGIHDWDDLVRPEVRVALVNPKTGGNGRYTFLAAWAYALKKFGGDEVKATNFVTQLYRHAPELASGGRGAAATFAQRGLADVLITFESEIAPLRRNVSEKHFEVVTPSVTLLVEFPVAIVDPVVDRKGTRKVAEAYLNFLYSGPGQSIIAANGFRPRGGPSAAEPKGPAEILNVDTVFGGWDQAQQRFFAAGGIFDQIMAKVY